MSYLISLMNHGQPFNLSRTDKLDLMKQMLFVLGFGLLTALLIIHPTFAAPNDGQNAKLAMWAVITIVCQIVRIVGVIFIIVGVVKFVIAHANEQGPEQQKAIMMLATGVVLIIVPTILIAMGDKFGTVVIESDTDNLNR